MDRMIKDSQWQQKPYHVDRRDPPHWDTLVLVWVRGYWREACRLDHEKREWSVTGFPSEIVSFDDAPLWWAMPPACEEKVP